MFKSGLILVQEHAERLFPNRHARVKSLLLYFAQLLHNLRNEGYNITLKKCNVLFTVSELRPIWLEKKGCCSF